MIFFAYNQNLSRLACLIWLVNKNSFQENIFLVRVKAEKIFLTLDHIFTSSYLFEVMFLQLERILYFVHFLIQELEYI